MIVAEWVMIFFGLWRLRDGSSTSRAARLAPPLRRHRRHRHGSARRYYGGHRALRAGNWRRVCREPRVTFLILVMLLWNPLYLVFDPRLRPLCRGDSH